MEDYELRRDYTTVLPGVYASRKHRLTALDRAVAAWKWSNGDCVLSGVSAAAVLGAKWVPDDAPPEIVTARQVRVRGLVTRRYALELGEVTTCGGMVVTSAPRTAFDMARSLSFEEAVVMVDSLGRATGVTPSDIVVFAQKYPGARGVRNLVKVAAAADPKAESPWETRTRLATVRGGLPRPTSQHVIRVHGRFVARVDLAWPEWKVAVEYDGLHHFTDEDQARRDVERWNALAVLGWTVIRVTRHQLRDGGAAVVGQVRAALRAAGAGV